MDGFDPKDDVWPGVDVLAPKPDPNTFPALPNPPPAGVVVVVIAVVLLPPNPASVLGVLVASMFPGLVVRGPPNTEVVDKVPFAVAVPLVAASPMLIGGGFFFDEPDRPRAAG
jgi:hypothetical protein